MPTFGPVRRGRLTAVGHKLSAPVRFERSPTCGGRVGEPTLAGGFGLAWGGKKGGGAVDGNSDRGSQSSVGTVVARKSWVAYVSPVLLCLFLLVCTLPLAFSQSRQIGWAVLAVIIGGLVYRIAVLRSYVIFYNPAGVWIKSGVLPWTKGFSGVKWRDLDEAVFSQTFLGWLFRTHTVTLRHRYTKAQEIFMRQCADGRRVSGLTNEAHMRAIESGSIG